MKTLLLVGQLLILFYFAALNLLYTVLAYFGLKTVVENTRTATPTALKALLESDAYRPISILVPAYNEERSIVSCVRSFLTLNFPELEVIVVSDGSKDRTVETLIEAYALIEIPQTFRRSVPTKKIKRMFRSATWPNLFVLEKENGGKADALNAAVNVSRYPLVCAVDADSLLDGEALLRASRLFAEDESVVAVGATIRALNGAELHDGKVTKLGLPTGWLERCQVVEYARAFLIGRAGWNRLDAVLIVSGAFGVFRRTAILEVGAWDTTTVGEDMEIIVRLHKHFRSAGRQYRILMSPDPVCWTEVPSDAGTLRRQRSRWQRGLFETLWRHRDMMMNPRYGKLGLIAFPYFLFFEALSPLIEVFGWLFLPLSALFGVLSWDYALAFTIVALLYGVLLSQLAVGIEALLFARYSTLNERLILILAAFVESMGYRQMLVYDRFMAMFTVWTQRGQWGAMKRAGIPATRAADGTPP